MRRTAPALLALLFLLLALAPLAEAAERQNSGAIRLDPGQSKEENLLGVKEGKAISYYFLVEPPGANQPKLRFNLHTHDDSGKLVYLRQETSTGSVSDTYEVMGPGDYSLEWTNENAQPVQLTFTWSIDTAATKGPPAAQKNTPTLDALAALAALGALALALRRRA